MSSPQKWAADKLDTLGPLTFEEAAAMVQVLATRMAQVVEGVRPPIDSYGASWPPMPSMDWRVSDPVSAPYCQTCGFGHDPARHDQAQRA